MSTYYLARGLAQRGHNIFLGCKPESFIHTLLTDDSITPCFFPFKSRFDRQTLSGIKAVAERHHIDIINAQSSYDRYNSIFAKWFYGVAAQIVHTRRQRPASIGGVLQNWLYKKGTDSIVAVSDEIKNDLLKLGFKDKHITVIYNGTPKEKYNSLDSARIDYLKKKFNITQSDFVIGCISRPKKQEQLLRALQHLSFKPKVIFVGIEPKQRFLELIDPAEYNKTIFIEGQVPHTQILEYFKICSVSILPSTTEGLSQSLLESMALGTPVIATAAAGNLDLIRDGENGLLFENNDSKNLARKIEHLKNNLSLWEQLKRNGISTALNDFSIERTIDNYEKHFQSLLQK